MSSRTDVLRVTTLAILVLVMALRRAERRVVERLATAAASGPNSAVGFPGLGWRERLVLKRLVWARAVGFEDQRYYLDPLGYAAFRRRRRRRATVVLGAVLILAAVVWWRAWIPKP